MVEAVIYLFFYGQAGVGEVSSVSTMFYTISTGSVSKVLAKC